MAGSIPILAEHLRELLDIAPRINLWETSGRIHRKIHEGKLLEKSPKKILKNSIVEFFELILGSDE